MVSCGAFAAVTRRSVLRGGAACVAAASAPMAFARTEAPWRIDLHYHFFTVAQAGFAKVHPDAGLPPFPADDVATLLADMDAGGTELAVLSSVAPTAGGDAAARQALVRATNERGAEIARAHPARFAFLCTLPIPDVESSLQELTHGLDVLGAVGAQLSSEALGLYLGDEKLAPLMRELDRRGVVVIVHPHSDACCANAVKGVPDTVVEFGTSTTRTIASLIFSGAAFRYPNIKFVFSHGGGTMPFLIERFLSGTSAEILPGKVVEGVKPFQVAQPPGGALQALRRFHYDTAQISNPVALRALATVVGPSQIVYGTDYWFRKSPQTSAALDASGVFNPRELRLIGRENALTLLPTLKGVLAS